ncbi:MAG: hypothetical protein GY755_13470 [Chloroflexi bacterium]|nr:hypothetical protein [Chloroflexota bacterium]
MNTMYIGSGDISALMAGKQTQSHTALLQRFVSGVKPYYNAKASPIDACRAGTILEDRYLLTLPDNYFSQYVVQSKGMDVFKCSLDFAKIEGGKVVDFDELKTKSFSDYLELEPIKHDNDLLLSFLKKKHKSYYNQVQEQLYCTELESCNLVFLSVLSYDDEENYSRNIKEGEFIKVRVSRDEKVISAIKERGLIFQQIKDCYYDFQHEESV